MAGNQPYLFITKTKIMKLKIVLIKIMFIFTLNITYSQNNLKDTLKYEIIYDFSYQENKEDSKNIKSEQMVLKVSKSFSHYISYNNLQQTNMYKGIQNSGETSIIKSRPKTEFLFSLIKDYNNDKIIFSDMIGLDVYSFEKPTIKLDWVLNNEETEILGYKCKKATTTFAGRDYIAWYSTEISISDGPYKFQGLPGLIFSIYDTKNHYKFTISKISKEKSIFDTNDEIFNPIKITEKEFKELKRKFREKPSSMLNSGGMTFPKELLDMGDKRAKERLKYENNPLELTD
jgi:GLPGLI family protein